MIPVGRLAPGDQWDQNLLDQLFANKLYPTGLEFKRVEGYPNADGCCLLIPSRYWHQHTDQITEAIERYDWCLAFRVGDEEDTFRVEDVKHPNIKWWVQTPRAGREYPQGTRFIGVGFPPHFNTLPAEPPAKATDVFLLGQDTHRRRRECFEALKNLPETVGRTEGFTQGAKPEQYAEWMVDAKIAPCPSGAVSVDSFRAFEALESHAIPVCDAVSPVDGAGNYWRRIFDNPPFPIIEDWSDAPGWIGDLTGWPANANRVAAWWMRQKREYVLGLKADLQALGAL